MDEQIENEDNTHHEEVENSNDGQQNSEDGISFSSERGQDIEHQDSEESNHVKFDILDDSESSNEMNYLPGLLIALIPLIKLFIILPGKIMRVILQVGDFYYLIQILNITVDFLTILLVGSYQISKSVGSIITLLFSLLLGNLLAVPAWEFFQFRWIKNHNPFETFFDICNLRKCFKNYETKEVYRINKITNYFAGVFAYFYLWAIIDFMSSKGKVFDIMNLLVILIIPGIKFAMIYVSLIVMLFVNIFRYKKQENSTDEDNEVENEDESETDQPVNKYIEIRNPFILAQFPNKETLREYRHNIKVKYIVFEVIKSVIIFVELIMLLIIYAKYQIKAGGVIFSLVVFIYISLFSLLISMPIWIINIFHRWDCLNIIEAIENINEKVRMNPIFNGFKYVCAFFQLLMPLFVCILLSIEGNRTAKTYFYTLSEEVSWNGSISNNFPYSSPISSVKSSMCFTNIYGLNLIQIAAIAAAPYYSDIKHFQDLISNSFFKDKEYDINLTFLKQKDDEPVLLRANFDNEETDFHLTIFSVRGSRTPVDWWLDVEMFVSSAMLTVARWIPILQRQEGTASKVVSKFMTLPLTLMAEATYTYKYINMLTPEISNFLNIEENKNRNILFTGHSLGGGLSKVLAHKFQFQSIAVSGPGISPIEDYVVGNNNDADKYFKSKLVDIVPDRDVVPRFETSGGTKYRVLCNEGVGECHNKLRTICQMGISCDDEYHVGDFCSSVFSETEYNKMKELAHRLN